MRSLVSSPEAKDRSKGTGASREGSVAGFGLTIGGTGTSAKATVAPPPGEAGAGGVSTWVPLKWLISANRVGGASTSVSPAQAASPPWASPACTAAS